MYVLVFVIVMDFYSLVIGLMVKPLFAFYKWHFILYFAHRKHIQKPAKKLKIVAEISKEFYSKGVGKYEALHQGGMVIYLINSNKNNHTIWIRKSRSCQVGWLKKSQSKWKCYHPKSVVIWKIALLELSSFP